MKKILSLGIVTASLLVLSSCNEKAKLATSIAGSWSGSAQRVETSDAKATTSVTRIINFMPDAGSKTGGTLEAVAEFSIETGTQLQATDTQPISVTASGNATISGRWEATDDDEIVISFDSNSLKVNVDPKEVVLEYTISTESAEPIDQTLTATAIAEITRTITPAMNHNVFNFSKIDDIKITGNLMSCEIGKKDFTFHREI